MRWLCLIILLILLILPTSSASADSSQDVVITATGYVEDMAPVDFTVTYISDYEIQLTWTNPPSTNVTMIRAAFGRVPTDRNDGYLVYSDNGSTATDWPNLVVTDEPLYYAAWRMSDTGVWTTTPATGQTEGEAMTYLVLGLLALGLTATMFATRKMMLGFPCVMMWAILGAYAYTRSLIPWGDWHFYLFFASAFGMTTFCALAMYGLREKKDTIAEGEMDEGGKGEGGYIDEEERKLAELFGDIEEDTSSRRTKELRRRAENRRNKL